MSKFTTAVRAGQAAMELGQTAADFRAADKKQLGRQAGQHAFSQGTETGKTVGKTWLKTFEVFPRLVCRGLQFFFALVACGFYGHRVDADRKAGHGYATEWLFAVTVAGLSAITAALFVAATPLGALPVIGSRLKLFKTYRAFAWDLILFISWLVVFGIMAGIFLKRDGEHQYKGAKTGPMKVAVWIDLVMSILWVVSGVYGAVKTFLGEKVDHLTDKVGNKMFTKKEGAKEYAESV